MTFPFNSRRCLFCNQKTKLTREHIYPEWLSLIVKPEEGFFSPSTWTHLFKTTEKGSNILSSQLNPEGKEIKYSDFTIKLVCAECNNGWMSALESDAQRILIPAIMGDPEKIRTSPEDAYKMSLWSIIKVVLISQTINDKFILDRFFLDLLYRKIIPEGFIVEIAKMDHSFLNFTFGSITIPNAVNVSMEQMEIAWEGFMVAGLHVGKVGFRVSYLKNGFLVNRVQINEELFILYPYDSKLPVIRFNLPEEQIETDIPGEVTALCNSMTICDSL